MSAKPYYVDSLVMCMVDAPRDMEKDLALCSRYVRDMDVCQILMLRGRIVTKWLTLKRVPECVNEVIDLIDGQLALREIAGDDNWR